MRGQVYARRSGGHYDELQYFPKLFKSEIKRAGISADQTSIEGQIMRLMPSHGQV